MLAGTDVGGQWDIPGFALHRDFDLLAGAGLSPLKVLQMTTLEPAIFLRRESTMGTVALARTPTWCCLVPIQSRACRTCTRSPRWFAR